MQENENRILLQRSAFIEEIRKEALKMVEFAEKIHSKCHSLTIERRSDENAPSREKAVKLYLIKHAFA